MNRSSIFSILLTIFLFLTISDQMLGQKLGADLSKLTISVTDIFGEPINPSKTVFKINRDFILEILESTDHRFVGFRVYPRYFSHSLNPRRNQPDHDVYLTAEQATKIMADLVSVRPLGPMICEDLAGAVTNSRMALVSAFEQGYLQKYVYSRAHQNEAVKTISLEIYYLRDVAGTVDMIPVEDSKKRFSREVRIDGSWYFGSEELILEMKVGKPTAARLAGPQQI